jgi:hypothetical protein
VAHAVDVEDVAEVRELNDEQPTYGDGGADTHPAAAQGGEGPGYFATSNNFVGPKYGLPGYKESHNWEDDADMMSPLIFDYRMYRVLIEETVADAEGMTEEALKTHWMQKIEENAYDKCPQGHLWFDANSFYEIHKDQPETSMGGAACKLIIKTYLEKGIFEGFARSKHQTTVPTSGNTKFATIATKLFDGTNQRAATVGKSFFEVLPGQYFRTPIANGDKADNMFAPARHITLAFWLQIAPQSKPPNAELFAYGGTSTDNFFRTGFGCIQKNIQDNDESKCYFIFVFDSDSRTEYFHSFTEDAFIPMNRGFTANRWAHVVMMLTTRNPGFVPDVAEGEGCPSNAAAAGDSCWASLSVYVDKTDIPLVDWNEGTDTTYAKAWGAGILKQYWESKVAYESGMEVERRFFTSAAQSCDSDINKCGEINLNALKWAFPWHGAYQTGVWFCDFQAVSSGRGMFGGANRQLMAVNAFWDIMGETKAISCSHSTEGNAEVTNDVTESDAPSGQVRERLEAYAAEYAQA